MFQEAGRSFAEEKIRPAASRRRRAPTPAEMLAQATELGVNMLGVPEELGGVMEERRARDQRPDRRGTRPRRHGDRLRGARPRRRRDRDRPLGHAEQEATYLPAFTGEDAPAAALAILEPRPLFDPLKLRRRRARRRRTGCSTAPSRCSPAPASASSSSSPPRPRGSARRCSWSSPAPKASRSRPSRRWACAPPPPAAW